VNKNELVHVKYVGKNMVPVGGKMLPSGEIREVRRFLAMEAKRYHPETVLILEDEAIAPAPLPVGEGGEEAPSSPATAEVASLQKPEEKVKDEHQPEHADKPAAKRRSHAK
jgi:hypothetical protein